ncbi:hypothetical protein, partial [Fulvivirga lutimaris]|uniref:hypothetical protein n=1 Tax=Fulvivirga lutimaris TaxID=1819566 RepID=UPI0016295B4B
DSFIVIRDFELLRGQPVSYGFAQVLEVGSIILLKNFCRITYGGSPMPGGYGMSQGSSTKVETFILTKQDSEKLWIVYSKKKKFNALLEDIVKDFPSDSPYKDVNTIKYEMMPQIIAEYNRLKENKDM